MMEGVISGQSHLDHLVAFDLETTGLSPRSDRILEIGAVRYDDALRPIDELEVVVDPQMPIPLAIQRLVGLTDEDVRGAPPPAEAAAQLAGFCGDAALIAHGGTFDLLFLRALLSEAFGSRLILRHPRPRAHPPADLREPQPPAAEPPPRHRPRAPAPRAERRAGDRRPVSGAGRRRPRAARADRRRDAAGRCPGARTARRHSSVT